VLALVDEVRVDQVVHRENQGDVITLERIAPGGQVGR